jgi:hypothetical protein
MFVIQHLPQPSLTLTAAAAVQALNDSSLRLHGLITTERWTTDGNETKELWRESRMTSDAEATFQLADLLRELEVALQSALLNFNAARGVV